MILLNRLNGQAFALNPDLLERAECTPDTVITLLNGAKYVVSQSLPELAQLVRDHRALILDQAQVIGDAPAVEATRPRPMPEHRANVLRMPNRGL